MTKKTSADRLAKLLGIPKSRGLEAVLKAQLIAAVLREVDRRGLTHAELAAHSGVSRSAVTGILSGSLQKALIDKAVSLARQLEESDAAVKAGRVLGPFKSAGAAMKAVKAHARRADRTVRR